VMALSVHSSIDCSGSNTTNRNNAPFLHFLELPNCFNNVKCTSESDTIVLSTPAHEFCVETIYYLFEQSYSLVILNVEHVQCFRVL
jgi:hypothetical protein